jgi:hypothetical protein
MQRSTSIAVFCSFAVTALLLTLSSSSAPADDGVGGKRCTLLSLRGRYGYTYQGTVEGFGGVAAVGPINFDGAGNTSATYSVNLGGTNFQGSFTGAYTVNPDCTGTVRIDLPLLGTSSHGRFVIVDGGKEAFFMGIDDGITVTGDAKRISPAIP